MESDDIGSEFTNAIRDARLDVHRDSVVYIDPTNQSAVEIATKIRTALEICDSEVLVRKIRYPER